MLYSNKLAQIKGALSQEAGLEESYWETECHPGKALREEVEEERAEAHLTPMDPWTNGVHNPASALIRMNLAGQLLHFHKAANLNRRTCSAETSNNKYNSRL